MPGHADAEHEQVAEPECQAGEKADLGDVDGVEAVIRIDPETDRAAGEHGGADVVADRIAGEARQRRDAIGHVFLADGPQRKEIIKRQRAKCADHAQRGERDMVRRDFGQRHQDHAGIDALEGADQGRDRKGDDEKARSDPEPFPADPFLEATPERGQQSMHSSSRQGRQQMRPSKRLAAGGGPSLHMRRPIRQKRPVVQSLTTPASALDRSGCHTPYICPEPQDAN